MPVELLDAVDAVYRFAVGQDLGERELYESAFAANAVLDFREPAARFGAEVPLMDGRAAIMEHAFPATAGLITTHTVANPRLAQTEAGGELYALVEAQHVDPDAPERRILLKNHYYVTVLAQEPGARIARLTIVNAWWAGDPSVLFPGG